MTVAGVLSSPDDANPFGMIYKGVPILLIGINSVVSTTLILIYRILKVPIQDNIQEPHIGIAIVNQGGVICEDEIRFIHPCGSMDSPFIPYIHVEQSPGNIPFPMVPYLPIIAG